MDGENYEDSSARLVTHQHRIFRKKTSPGNSEARTRARIGLISSVYVPSLIRHLQAATLAP